MTISEVLLQDFDPEVASTRRLLERIPEDSADYKPHDKSFTIGKLAMHVATLPHFGKTILTTPGMDMADKSHSWPDNTFRSREVLLSTFDSSINECRAALKAASVAFLSPRCQLNTVLSDETSWT